MEDLIYNPAWFQEEQKSPFEDVVNSMTKQPTNSYEENNADLFSLFDQMKSYISELNSIKDTQEVSENIEQEIADTYDSDIDDFRQIFGEDENSPVDWSKMSNFKQNKVASQIYKNVLESTGSIQKAQNALKIAEHESSFNPLATNGSMLGLFQFNQDNQKKYNITKNSSVEEQVNAWLQYQVDNKIPIGQEGVGQLAPAYIGKNKIYSKGSKEYSSNKYLDKNKDGILSDSEINNFYGLPSLDFNPILKSKNINVKNIHPDLKSWYQETSNAFGGLTITSGTDGTHTKNSKHYSGNALDIRSSDKNGKALLQDVVENGAYLGNQSRGQLYKYNGVKVLVEKDHLHINL